MTRQIALIMLLVMMNLRRRSKKEGMQTEKELQIPKGVLRKGERTRE
jgi:hypothetical protein